MEPTVRARAPMRVDLAGGWTDVVPYARVAGGAVVNVAVSLYAHAAVSLGGDGVNLHALDLGGHVTARRRADLRPDGELALLKAAARRYGPERAGFTVVTHSDAPPGSGLGGSGALGVALVAALRAARGETPIEAELAAAAHELEREEAGVMGGKQDQYAAALGGLQFLAFGEPAVTATRLHPPAALLRELEHRLIICYTGASHASDATHRRVWKRFAAGDAGVRRLLDGLKTCAVQMRRALAASDLPRVGEVLNANWELQQQLTPDMRTEVMARLERSAVAAGAEGIKACGAGAGGCLAVLARAGQEMDVVTALRTAGGTVLRATFDTKGVVVWRPPS